MISSSQPEEPAVPAPCKKRSGRHPLLIKKAACVEVTAPFCTFLDGASVVSSGCDSSGWSLSSWRTPTWPGLNFGRNLRCCVWEREQTPCTGWWSWVGGAFITKEGWCLCLSSEGCLYPVCVWDPTHFVSGQKISFLNQKISSGNDLALLTSDGGGKPRFYSKVFVSRVQV